MSSRIPFSSNEENTIVNVYDNFVHDRDMKLEKNRNISSIDNLCIIMQQWSLYYCLSYWICNL